MGSCILSSEASRGCHRLNLTFGNMLLQPPTTDGVNAAAVVEKMKGMKREVNNNTENETKEIR